MSRSPRPAVLAPPTPSAPSPSASAAARAWPPPATSPFGELAGDNWAHGSITGCALSDLRITQDGGAAVSLIGHQAKAGDAHAPVLDGQVRDALAP